MTEPNIEIESLQERLQRIKEERAKAKKPCICKVGDPCDYHAATCITCHPRCGGHPSMPDISIIEPTDIDTWENEGGAYKNETSQ